MGNKSRTEARVGEMKCKLSENLKPLFLLDLHLFYPISNLIILFLYFFFFCCFPTFFYFLLS